MWQNMLICAQPAARKRSLLLTLQKPGGSREEKLVMPKRGSLLFGTIVIVTAVGAFTAVRTWLVPVGAAAMDPATVTVDTQPAGAELLVDNQPHGTTPQTLTIAPGVHTLLVRIQGAQRTVQLTLGAGAHMAQYFDLQPNGPAEVVSPARLSIVTDPPGARVVVDGRPRGMSPLMLDDLAPAPHNVTVTSDTGSAQQTITLVNGTIKEIVFSLPQSKAPFGGWVTVASPFPVDVIERGEVVGTSGTARTMLTAGSHDVVLRNDSVGYESQRRIDVVAGRVATLEVVPPEASLNVNARPWADVLIDGVGVGQTPLANLQVPVGTHQVTFRHPQLGERRETVLISAKGVNRLAVDLAK
jgi:hypothetical protein